MQIWNSDDSKLLVFCEYAINTNDKLLQTTFERTLYSPPYRIVIVNLKKQSNTNNKLLY